MSTIEISGSVKNIKKLFEALALPRSNKSSGKGDNLEFSHRKVIVKSNGTLIARQTNGSIYSQVVCQQNVETPFIRTKGEGDIMFDMDKALKYIRELGTYDTVNIIHDTELHQTLFRSIKENDEEEWGTFEPSKEIDDGRNETKAKCDCTDTNTCTKCNGSGKVAIPLSYQNQTPLVPLTLSPYPQVDVQFEIDTSIMRMIGDKTESLLDSMYPIQFNKAHLLIFAGDQKDISNDYFKKQIPLSYIKNDMVGQVIILDRNFRNVFGSLDGKIMIYASNVPDKEQSIYVLKNDMGFHCGTKMMAKLKDV